jgi:hypothetical protein
VTIPLIGACCFFYDITQHYAVAQKGRQIPQLVNVKVNDDRMVFDDRLRVIGGRAIAPFIVRFDCIRMCPVGDQDDSKRLYFVWLLDDRVKLPLESTWEYPNWNPRAFPGMGK